MARRPASAVTPEVVFALARRPRLWGTAWHQARVMARRGWWRRPPFLPVPAPAYARFRMETQYGDNGHRPEPDDVLRYLTWCKGYGARRQ